VTEMGEAIGEATSDLALFLLLCSGFEPRRSRHLFMAFLQMFDF
jgi:hypothetical protein